MIAAYLARRRTLHRAQRVALEATETARTAGKLYELAAKFRGAGLDREAARARKIARDWEGRARALSERAAQLTGAVVRAR